YNTSELKDAGFSASSLNSFNPSTHTLSALDSAGYNTSELKDAGFSASSLNS
mgnify:CR=1